MEPNHKHNRAGADKDPMKSVQSHARSVCIIWKLRLTVAACDDFFFSSHCSGNLNHAKSSPSYATEGIAFFATEGTMLGFLYKY